MPDTSLTIEQVLPLLATAPARIAALTTDRPPAHLHTPPNPDQWSANEVLAHLRACADVWGTCIVKIVAEDASAFRAVSPRSWIRRTDYLQQAFQPSLRAFATQRADLLAVLEGLPPEGWSRTATVTRADKAFERTVLFYARSLADHEQPHLEQVERIMTTLHL